MKLEAEAVGKILKDCLFKSDEIKDGAPTMAFVQSNGVTTNFGFHKERLESHRQEIKELLAELPDQFDIHKGGGWSFLNACMDKHGTQWGEHMNIQELMCLGQALGLVKVVPRVLWPTLPGGVPYFSYDLGEKGA